MQPATIRPGTAADCAEIAALWNPVIRETAVTFTTVEHSAASLAALIAARDAAGQAFLVARDSAGGLAGFAGYGPFRAGPGYARTMEHSIILAPAARGHGLGRRLLTAVEDHARAGGVCSLIAAISSANPAGRAFHAAMGYTFVATLHRVGVKFDRWFDLHLMQKFL